MNLHTVFDMGLLNFSMNKIARTFMLFSKSSNDLDFVFSELKCCCVPLLHTLIIQRHINEIVY